MLSGFPNSAKGLAAAVVLLSGAAALASAPARAADLGGDCCADLESRVAELEATTARKGNRKVSLTISGRVNANILWWSETSTGPSAANGPFDQTHDIYFGNSAVDSRDPNFVLSGAGKISADLSAGFTMQIDEKFGGADTQTTVQGPPAISVDTTYLYLRSNTVGELRLGNMASASDDAYYLNFGGGSVGGLSGANHTGSFLLRDAAGRLTDTSYLSALGEMSDNNEPRLMYVSPTVSGLTFKADIGGEDTAAASLTWIGKFNTIEIEAGAGYQVSQEVDGDCASKGPQCTQATDTVSLANPWTDATHSNLRALGISGSIWDTASGLYVSGEWSKVYADPTGRNDPTNWFAQAGWAKNASGSGQTTLYASYDRTADKIANGTSAHYWNIGIDQAIDAVSSNLYLHYQHDSFDTSGVILGAGSTTPTSTGGAIDAQSIDSVTGGMVVHF